MRRLQKLRKIISLFLQPRTLGQLINPLSIPLIIINFNQLFYLEKLINFAIKTGFKNIVIIDNLSTYEPLLAYYKSIENKKQITIKRMQENHGHMVFFEQQELYNTYGKGFFILTDADILPNPQLPKIFLRTLLHLLLKYYDRVTKVGFALQIDDLPANYSAREKVIEWESQYWKNEVTRDIYITEIDTTFALYKPNFKASLKHRLDFYKGIRVAGDFTAKHGGWYMDYENLTEEQEFYVKCATKVSTWAANKGQDLLTNNNKN